ncbi:MAG: hypothetical protein U1E10_09010 [Bdellovibrionales bacterium]|nr:hypothetical protein [Bdellovibrionales bacterium]
MTEFNKRNFLGVSVPPLCLLLCLVLQPELSFASNEAEKGTTGLTPFAQVQTAAVTARIATELNQAQLSNDLRAALLGQARPEDTVPLKSLLAKYKRNKDLKFETVFGRLVARNRSGTVMFSAEVDFANTKRFAINGREWLAPDTGSILNSLNDALFSEKKKTASKIDFLLPAADAQEAGSSATRSAGQMASYIFVSALQKSRPEQGASPADYLSKKDVYSTLLRGSEFPKAGFIDKAQSLLDAVTMAPIKVQCTADGAKGFAIVGNSDVEFHTKNDLSVILKSKKHEQAVKFIAQGQPLQAAASKVRKAADQLQSLEESANASKVQVSEAKAAIDGLVRLCSLHGTTPHGSFSGTVCGDAKILEDKVSNSKLRLRVFKKVGQKEWDTNGKQHIRNEYYSEVANWFVSNQESISLGIEELGRAAVIRDHTGTMEACQNKDCSKSIPPDPSSVYGFRIPPNDTEETVRKALAFKPRSSPKSKAQIQYACATQNQACERVHLVDGDDLSGSDLVAANDLINAANTDLVWKENDPSVSQPLSILRALGPCCADKECRAKVVEAGANLVPSNGTKTNGVAQ